MKISALLSLAFACTVSASTYGQNYKLSMNKQDCSISEVLKEIEKNSEYTFFLNDNQVNVNRKTSVKANNASLEEVLEQALKNTGYQYEIVDRQIIIKSKSVSSVSHPNALFQTEVSIDIRNRSVRSAFNDNIRPDNGFSQRIFYLPGNLSWRRLE